VRESIYEHYLFGWFHFIWIGRFVLCLVVSRSGQRNGEHRNTIVNTRTGGIDMSILARERVGVLVSPLLEY